MTIASAWTVSAHQPVEYRVETTTDVLHPDNPALLDGERGARRLIVTDSTVDEIYGDRIRAYARTNLRDHQVLVLPHGEASKQWSAVETVLEAVDAFKLDRRREPIIAIGGGVLTDIVGFASSIYRRSTPFVRVPTTLIGIVDASVGVKTGVNFRAGKNKIGTYFAASRSVLDTTFLATLDARHVSNGLAEILKIALIKDERLFDLLEAHGSAVLRSRFQSGTSVEREILERAIGGMLDELRPNLWEHVLERVVDYGHTFSPTIEMRALPELLHGEAVGLDMALTTGVALHRGLVTAEQADRVFATLTGLGLPTTHPAMRLDDLVRALEDTTRHRDGRQRLPLPVGIGAATFVDDVTREDIAAGLQAVAVLSTAGLEATA
ncbi:sedoheptulose 7-phosphate cyclase [Cellulomonas sp. HD19AZ1]|uniref:sedoheptulose 7-phosphate cyclase n=1 Tax=Cellulomonas sp. HD19AZ1 TaxID=2559593 RepID=UPI0010712960|nr:sedoheptulose 7-phosphate cyclase [Cellulomonas sp. HD19AZ1]TFH72870.1 iron-containing alcohol dehydrogenase [Cellulomonas sp. HD19AZ1]